jgi:hypothetical protein
MTTTTPLTASKSKSNCMTFRIPVEKINQLHQKSATKQVSLNTLVNQIFKEYLDWHSLAPPAKLCYLPKSFLIRRVNELDEVELSELARETGKNDLVDISLFLKGAFSLASVSEITETWLKIAQMSYRCEINGDSFKIIIQHDMGLKYSYLIKEISRYLIVVAFDTKSSCDVTENTILIEVKP